MDEVAKHSHELNFVVIVAQQVSITLGYAVGSFSIASGINNRGKIVDGSLTSGHESFRGFDYSNNQLHHWNLTLEPGTAMKCWGSGHGKANWTVLLRAKV